MRSRNTNRLGLGHGLVGILTKQNKTKQEKTSKPHSDGFKQQ